MWRIGTFLIAIVLLFGCLRDFPNTQKTVQKAIENSKFPRQFNELFPDAEHEISLSKRRFPGGWRRVDEWRSRVGLHDRYIFEMTVAVDFSDTEMKQIEDPQFVIAEVPEVWFDEEKRLNSRQGEFWDIDENQWGKLFESRGDFSKIDIPIKKEAPVENFYQWYRIR